MHEVKSNLYPCAHCLGIGTCKNGTQQTTCIVCINYHELKGKEFEGLPCSICGGIGQAEPKTERINKRMPALLGFAVIFMLISGVFLSAISKSSYFSELLAFSGTIIGTVLGFYYSDRSRSNP